MKRVLNRDKTCSAEDCDDPVHACDLCQSHYNADRRARPEVKERRKALRARPEVKKKIAAHRATYKAKPEVKERRKAYDRERRAKPGFKERETAYIVAYNARPENKADKAKKNLSRWGMTPEDYDRMLVEQGGGCFICGTNTPGGHGRFHVDHDHACCPGQKSCGKCIRELLCAHCNFMLGHALDDPAILRAGADYIEKHRDLAGVCTLTDFSHLEVLSA